MEKITQVSLLDFLIRDRELEAFTNVAGIGFSLFEDEGVSLDHLLKDQTDDDMREVRLWSDDMDIAEFMAEFGIASVQDLEQFTPELLWKLYRADRGYISLFDGVDDVDMRIIDGVKTLEDALVYGGKEN